jgi:hypothetical protein
LTSQLEFSPRKRGREVKVVSEKHETVKSKKKTNASNSIPKDGMSKESDCNKVENSQAMPTVEETQLAPGKEPENQRSITNKSLLRCSKTK